jgi:hypothetical protein
MARTVVRNSEVPHLWAHQTQDHARGNGSISFSGKSIYSYAAEIGRLVTAPNGETVALLIDRTWSPTTSGHQSAARGAVSHLPHFTIPDLHGNHAKNLAALIANYRSTIDTLFRARKLPSEWQLNHAREQAGDATRYAEVFDLPAPEVFPETDRKAVLDYHNEPDRAAKRALKAEREKAILEARQRTEAAARAARIAANAQAIAEWRAGTRYNLPHDAARDEKGGALIRIKGNTLETSLGASVPLSHAIKVVRRVAACRAAGVSWHRNGETIRVGNFQVDAIDPDGSFRAGCHSFNWPEIEQAARLAGALDEAMAA